MELGFTLREIRELLSLRVAADKTCADVRDLAVVLCKRTGAVFTVGNSEFRFVWTSCVRLGLVA